MCTVLRSIQVTLPDGQLVPPLIFLGTHQLVSSPSCDTVIHWSMSAFIIYMSDLYVRFYNIYLSICLDRFSQSVGPPELVLRPQSHIFCISVIRPISSNQHLHILPSESHIAWGGTASVDLTLLKHTNTWLGAPGIPKTSDIYIPVSPEVANDS